MLQLSSVITVTFAISFYRTDIKDSKFFVIADSEDPDADRYAPSPNSSTGNYTMTPDRWKKIRSKMMYWFFDKGGDNDKGDLQTDVHSSMPQIHKNFNFQLPFFGFRFNYTRVSVAFVSYNATIDVLGKRTQIYNTRIFIGLIDYQFSTDIDERLSGIQ